MTSEFSHWSYQPQPKSKSFENAPHTLLQMFVWWHYPEIAFSIDKPLRLFQIYYASFIFNARHRTGKAVRIQVADRTALLFDEKSMAAWIDHCLRQTLLCRFVELLVDAYLALRQNRNIAGTQL